MSVTDIPPKVKFQLWALSGGRCEIRGCNKLLSESAFASKRYNAGIFAHIVADSPDGPRGNSSSKDLADKIENIMFVCPNCHKLIDSEENLSLYTVEELTKMKKEHEDRIKQVTGITEDLKCHSITYFPRVGSIPNIFDENVLKNAMLPEFTTNGEIIRLYMDNSYIKDNENVFWDLEKRNLEELYKESVLPLISKGKVSRLAVFALAPMPLLIRLGTLLTDKTSVSIYQKHRVPDTWKWLNEDIGDFKYIVEEPNSNNSIVALNLSLSGTIDNSRIYSVLSDDVSVWKLTIEEPSNDFVRNKEQVEMFNKIMRELFEVIKRKHGHNITLHVFPACPISLCIELGRVWMPKCDMNLSIYDENTSRNGFIHCFDIVNDY